MFGLGADNRSTGWSAGGAVRAFEAGFSRRRMAFIVLTAAFVVGSSGGQLWAGRWERPAAFSHAVQPLEYVEQIVTEPIDLDAVRLEDRRREQEGAPYRFATPHLIEATPLTSGTWEELDDETLLWRLQVSSSQAVSLNLGFTRFSMPPGGRLFIYSADQSEVLGPFTEQDNEQHGQLWTPVIGGDAVVVELSIPVSELEELELELGSINHGYRGLKPLVMEKPMGDSGWCNVNVACPEGDPWRDQIRSVAMYTYSGSAQCTGVLLNNTAADCKPYFLTAYHCDVDAGVAPTIVVYWKYEASTCSGTTGPLSYYQTGAIFRAGYESSDFTLVELDDMPSASFDVYYAGWDRGSGAPASGVAIHHPSGDLKKISSEDDPLSVTSYGTSSSPGDGTHLRVADWDLGTTEPGSSGCPIFNSSKRVVGQLHGGLAACGNNLADWFGRFYTSWTGGGSSSTGLADWLDPGGAGVSYLDGTDCGCTCSLTVSSPSVGCFQPGAVVSITWSSECNPSNVRIELYKSGSFDRTIILSTADDGWHDWTIPSDGGLAGGCDYRIKVTAVSDSSCHDYGDYFCIATPPQAEDDSFLSAFNTPVTIILSAIDEGCPDPPGELGYIITTLPDHGSLSDPCGGAIAGVPYTLLDNNNRVVYTPEMSYVGMDSFGFKANDGGTAPNGGDSNIATVSIDVSGAVYLANMETDPGWSASGEWQWGVPAGQGGVLHGNPDPTSGHTGSKVYGINLNGNYSTTVGGPYYLKTQAIDCMWFTDVHLRLYRWLNSDYQGFVYATIEVSNDDSTWELVWENGGPPAVTDSSWQLMDYDISSVADGQATVYIRWGHRVASDVAYPYSGWNIDDVEIVGVYQYTLGDFDGDGDVDFADFDILGGQWLGVPGSPSADIAPEIPDGFVDGLDLAVFAKGWLAGL